MRKRIVMWVALACALALIAPMCALAENNAYKLVAAFNRLGFDTHNVSLKLNAKFMYDGEWFKTFTGEYKQDGTNSYMYVSLDTPKDDGSVYTGGFTVIGNGDTAYSNDTYDGNYYVEHPAVPNDTVLTGSALTKAGMTTLEYAAAALHGVLDNVIISTPVDGGERYEINMTSAPDLVNGALTYLALNAIQSGRYYYYFEDNSATLEFADWDAQFAHYFKQIVGAEMPVSFLEKVAEAEYEDETWNLYSNVYDKMWLEAQDALNEYDSGIVYMQPDGTHEWYATTSDYLRATGVDYVYYTDYYAAFASYYELMNGTPLTDELTQCIMNSSNNDLWDAYITMCEDMDAYYKQIASEDPETVAIRVAPDGTYALLDKIQSATGDTLTRSIMRSFASLSIGKTDMAVTLNEAGDIASAGGTLAVELTDKKGEAHTLLIEFEAEAYDYGATSVAEFDPDNYGYLTYEEYIQFSGSGDTEFDYEEYCARLRALPASVEFNGKTYDTMIIIEGEG